MGQYQTAKSGGSWRKEQIIDRSFPDYYSKKNFVKNYFTVAVYEIRKNRTIPIRIGNGARWTRDNWVGGDIHGLNVNGIEYTAKRD